MNSSKSLCAFHPTILMIGLVTWSSHAADSSFPKLPEGYRLLYEQNFEMDSAIREFVMSDPKAWKRTGEQGNHSLELTTKSDYKPEVRSPTSIALLANKVFGDFILEADVLSTVESPSPRAAYNDLCLFFGMQSPEKFYYAHIAVAAEPHAHNIFLVNDQPRVAVGTNTTSGVKWGNHVWHKVRLERKVADGSIKVFFDDLTKPIMLARDKTLGPGYIGLGSFSDIGKFDNLKIWGPSFDMIGMEFFQKP